MKKVIKMEKSAYSDSYVSSKTKYNMLCEGVLHCLFDFPWCNTIYLTVSDKKMPNSYKVEVCDIWCCSIKIHGVKNQKYEYVPLFQEMFNEINNATKKNTFCWCQLSYIDE